MNCNEFRAPINAPLVSKEGLGSPKKSTYNKYLIGINNFKYYHLCDLMRIYVPQMIIQVLHKNAWAHSSIAA